MSSWNSFLFGNSERPRSMEDFALPTEGLKYVESFDWNKNQSNDHFFNSSESIIKSYDCFEQSSQNQENNNKKHSEEQNSLNIFNELKDQKEF